VITSAGLVLAGTFAVLATLPVVVRSRKAGPQHLISVGGGLYEPVTLPE